MAASLKWIVIGCTAYLLISVESYGQVLSSPLKRGTWAKFSVSSDGIYKINYDQLQSADINPGAINPKYIRLYGSQPGMLPQPNSEPRTNNLQELAITVVGESDEIFDGEDYILFYGQGPDIKKYDSTKKLFRYENHLYSDRSFYFITIGNTQGKRMGSSQNIGGTHPVVNTYMSWIYHEIEEYNRLKSGRKWFGERFDPSDEITFILDVPGIIEDSPIRIVSSVMAESTAASSFNISLNGSLVGTQHIPPLVSTTFGIKGIQKIDTLSFTPSNIIVKDKPQQLSYRFVSNANTPPVVGYLDFLLLTMERELALYGNQTFFYSTAALGKDKSTFVIGSFPEKGIIWDITNPFECMNQAYTQKQTEAIFSTTTEPLKHFAVADINNINTPEFVETVVNQNLYVNHSADLLIVTHPLFQEEAQRLANHRQSHNDINVLVVTTDEIYNDYSGGKQDPTAIRDFARHVYGGGLKNILLFGRGSYDFKDRLSQNTSFVPIYESRNSLAPLATYSSDDYFTFFDPSEGEWAENNTGVIHTMDIGVGRLPVRTSQEAKTVIDKLIAYDENPQRMGDWRKKILFVADDGDNNLHQKSADQLAEDIEENHPSFNTQKIYLDAFEQLSRPGGQVSPAARQALKEVLEQGVVIVNFIGHGSKDVWLQERILDEKFIDEWENDIAYPLLITATCDFGVHDDPHHLSSGEKALKKADGGAIALIAATRLVRASSNTDLNKAFYDALFKKEDKTTRDLGTLFKETKNNSTTNKGVSNRNFSLLGDPSMQLAIPKKDIVITSIKTATGSDTLKALSKVIVKGEVREKEMKTPFNGTVNAILWDKVSLSETLGDLYPGDNNRVVTYKTRDNVLFRGKASVNDGEFQLEFVMPQNTAYEVGNGKLSLYAVDSLKQHDASGGRADFKVGARETETEEDNTPPTIQLFIDDTTFVDGGISSYNIWVVAELYDQHGINITRQNGGNEPIIVLDGIHSFEAGKYYVSNTDDFTRGTIAAPLTNLAWGRHTVELRAWDVYNNLASAKINFNVAHGEGLIIDRLFNHPNPFAASTQIQFTHNRPGKDLQVTAIITTLKGQLVNINTYNVPASLHTVSLPEWRAIDNTGARLNDGIYFLRLIVRSLNDREKHEKSIKLIILQ